MAENKTISVKTKDGEQIPAFYRPLVSEPSMVAVFDAETGQQIGNFDKDLFESRMSPEQTKESQ